ncbi:MAG: ABC transporter permease [Armatimonadetes bacterium]|nr:ABC transporter permease [Armatimonadota bacterium]
MTHKFQHTLVIEAGREEHHYWADLWRYRELFFFLSWRDVLVRYKQTVIGVAWSVLRPVLTMVVFSIIFGKLAKLPSGGVPYPILVFTAMLPWQLFAGSLNDCSGSVVASAGLITKVYFPRVIIPASTVIVNLIDFFLSFVILCFLMVFYHFVPSWRIIVLPAFLALAVLSAFGVGLWASALNVKYRDFRYIVPFLTQMGLYISPVGFSSNIIPEKWRLLYSANPMVGVIDGFRWAIIGSNVNLYWPGFALSVALTLLVLFTGLRHFRKMERDFADII